MRCGRFKHWLLWLNLLVVRLLTLSSLKLRHFHLIIVLGTLALCKGCLLIHDQVIKVVIDSVILSRLIIRVLRLQQLILDSNFAFG